MGSGISSSRVPSCPLYGRRSILLIPLAKGETTMKVFDLLAPWCLSVLVLSALLYLLVRFAVRCKEEQRRLRDLEGSYDPTEINNEV